VPAPNRLTAGPDGALWFTAYDAGPATPFGRVPIHDAIVRVTLGGTFTVFPLPQQRVVLDGITAGPDGNLWFAEFDGNRVGRITPEGVITQFRVPPYATEPSGDQPNSQPHTIVPGPDGNLWFPDLGWNRVGYLTPAGRMREFPLPPHAENPGTSAPYGIAAGSDGNLWFTELTGMRIGRITPTGGITEFKLPGAGHAPSEIAAGHDGNLWFSEQPFALLGRITPEGVITEYPLPTSQSQPIDLVAAPDGNLWFADAGAQALARVTPTGVITEFPLAPQLDLYEGPRALAVGPDGALWFTYAGGIGRFSL
jgi:streptogramin lyase